jgi:L-lysine exporter family protein LysE/ArgO
MNSYLTGMGVSASLIMAIGAQNAFVLSQGMKRQFYLAIPLLCSLSDALLITVGVLGVGELLSSRPILALAGTLGGFLFLIIYGIGRFRSFLKPSGTGEEEPKPPSLKTALLLTMAVTWLNPHVYLDTIILLGGISSGFPRSEKLGFAAGAVTSSFLWFFSLSLGGRLLSPLFKNPRFGRGLDLAMALLMGTLAFSLGRDLFTSIPLSGV